MEEKDEMENTREFPKVTDNDILKTNDTELVKEDKDITIDNLDEKINEEILNNYLNKDNDQITDKIVKEEKKNNNLKFILIFLIIITLCGIVFGIFIYLESRPIKQVWGNIYYEYLKNFKEISESYPEDVQIEKPDEYQLHFYDAEGSDNPVMVADYQYNNENFVSVYYIRNNMIDSIDFFDPAHIELLYNVESGKYNYYIVSEEDDLIIYSELGGKTNEDMSNLTEDITIKKGEVREVTDVNGNVHSISKFDETFIKLDIEDEGIKFKVDEDRGELKKDIAKKADEYEDINKISRKLSKEVKKSLDKLLKKQEELSNYALEAKTKEEDKAKEEASKGIKVENYTISYGTYKWTIDGQELGGLVINDDGSCIIDGEACTYSISSHDFAQDISTAGHPKTCLEFKTSNYSIYLYPYEDNELGDGDLGDYKLAN